MGKRYETNYDAESRTFTKVFNDPDKTTFTVSIADLPPVSQAYIEGYGVTQICNDCHAGAKSVEEMIAAVKQKVTDLNEGVLRRRASGLGIGINVEQLTQALANVLYNGNTEQATEKLAPFIPSEEDDEETFKAKKARLRSIRNMGEIRMEIDKMNGKDTGSLLDQPLETPEAQPAAQSGA